jgi:hypothetical protein
MEFFTWEVLGSYAGCLAATLIITQLTKGLIPKAIPTQVFSYVVALVTLIAAHAALGTLDWSAAGLIVFNAAIVSLAANGGFDGIKAILTSTGILKDPGGFKDDEVE